MAPGASWPLPAAGKLPKKRASPLGPHQLDFPLDDPASSSWVFLYEVFQMTVKDSITKMFIATFVDKRLNL